LGIWRGGKGRGREVRRREGVEGEIGKVRTRLGFCLPCQRHHYDTVPGCTA